MAQTPMTQPLHVLNARVALDFGTAAGVLFQDICYWTRRNRQEGRNLHRGKAWMYRSLKEFYEAFPYLTENAVYIGLKRLRKAGLIETGHFNKKGYDRTTWYTLGPQAGPYLHQVPISGIFNHPTWENPEMEGVKNPTPIPEKKQKRKQTPPGEYQPSYPPGLVQVHLPDGTVEWRQA